MKRLAIAAAGLALVAALLVLHGPWVQAQPVASITLPPPGETVQLYPGCNNIALTFPEGTASETVVQAVTPAGAVRAMWRHNAAQNRFEGFSPAAPQASDLLTVDFLDAVWLCVAGGPPIARTTPPAPPITVDEYVQNVLSILDSHNEAVNELVRLVQNSLYDEPLWWQAVTSELSVIKDSYANILTITPPPSLVDAHAAIVTGLSLHAQGADLTETALRNRDLEAARAADDLFAQGNAYLSLATALLPHE